MTVVINQAAMTALLDSPDGPVGRFVAAKALEVTVAAQANVRAYFHTARTLNVDQDVGLDRVAEGVVVGIRDNGAKSRRLASDQAQDKVNWLRRALDSVRS